MEKAEDLVWVGLDLGLHRTHVCILDHHGNPVQQQECATSFGALEQALGSVPIGRIGMIAVEAGSDTNIVRKLRNASYPVTIFEAYKTSKFLAIRRNKTDANDALGLADLARLGRKSVSQVHLKSPECQQIRALLVTRKRLVLMRMAADGLLRSRFRTYGHQFKAGRGAGGLQLEVDRLAAKVAAEEGVDLVAELRPLVDLRESLAAYLALLDRDVAARAKSSAACRLLMSVPGVGPICALSFYSAIGDPDRFRASVDVGPYLGLNPRRRQSGSVARNAGITKAGCRMTRTYLVTAALIFATTAPDCSLKRWHLALRDRSGPSRARVALARKLAVLMVAMWKNGSPFELQPEGVRTRLCRLCK